MTIERDRFTGAATDDHRRARIGISAEKLASYRGRMSTGEREGESKSVRSVSERSEQREKNKKGGRMGYLIEYSRGRLMRPGNGAEPLPAAA